MSDEEWLVAKAKCYLKHDIHTAKAWLITARTLFPRNFNLQFEAYSIEKGHKNVRQAAKILEDMLIHFAGQQTLWQEVQTMIDALQTDNKDDKTNFLTDVFTTLPSSLQSHMLLRIAETSHDIMLQTRLMLLVLSRHSNHIPEQGVKLIETLLNNEKMQPMPSPVNCFRKYLVCDVLPLVLKSDLPQVQPKQFIRWLQKSIEFYICYVTQPPQGKCDTPLSPGPELASPKFGGFFGFSNKWRVAIPGLSDKECLVEKPSQKLGEIVMLVGKHLSWDTKDFFKKSSELQWQRILELNESSTGDSVKQVLYCATVLCFTSLIHYVSTMSPSSFAATASNNSSPTAVLIEGIKSCSSSEPRSKKAKLMESGSLQLIGSKKMHNAKEINSHFLVAFNCWRFLQETETVQKEFTKLLQHWKSDNWSWLKGFEVDVLIYQGHFKEASNKLLAIKSMKQKSAMVPVDLQLACCFYAMNNYSRAFESLLQMVENLSSSGVAMETAEQSDSQQSGRQLQLMLCVEAEIMPYTVHLMITCCKEKSLKTYAPDDSCLGHLLILIQYNWPRYEMILAEVVDKIKRQGSFTYNLFFNYVVNIDILEEFAYLKCGDAGKITLDILPISTKSLAQFRTVTRGVNKGVKEDFKVHLEKQVCRSGENTEQIVQTFLIEEQQALQQSLL